MADENATSLDYSKPEIVDYGSLVKLTRACDSPGTGDTAFPDTLHTTFFSNGGVFCVSA
jgi:hypothetical protein